MDISGPNILRQAILVDGGFYRKRAATIAGKKSATERADELERYCRNHYQNKHDSKYLYRIFYYDCPPLDRQIYHPLFHKSIYMKNSETYVWSIDFFNELKKRRKFALRMGKLDENGASYRIKQQSLKKLLSGAINISDLSDQDFEVAFGQKGVDMRIGLDISSLAFKKQVDQIILISGDSDFVPAAKHARREGIDFILDPLGQQVNSDLLEHIDGLRSFWHKLVPKTEYTPPSSIN